jgi:hypothetical protein
MRCHTWVLLLAWGCMAEGSYDTAEPFADDKGASGSGSTSTPTPCVPTTTPLVLSSSGSSVVLDLSSYQCHAEACGLPESATLKVPKQTLTCAGGLRPTVMVACDAKNQPSVGYQCLSTTPASVTQSCDPTRTLKVEENPSTIATSDVSMQCVAKCGYAESEVVKVPDQTLQCSNSHDATLTRGCDAKNNAIVVLSCDFPTAGASGSGSGSGSGR